MKSKVITTILLISAICLSIFAIVKTRNYFSPQAPSTTSTSESAPQPSPTLTPTATPTATPSATPTPKPLTFAQMNAQYGPCVKLPTLMYHHIQDPAGQTSPSVSPEFFQPQMEYLQTKGYTTVSPQQLINFFSSGTPLPAKPVMITFDDGYADFASNAVPILNQFSHKAVMFLSTGLVNNPDYLTWDQIAGINSSNISFGNHTWSHKNTQSSDETIEAEIGVAQTQLEEKGLGSPKTFAYPYGIVGRGVKYLQANEFLLAFTTQPGSTLCSQQSLVLPRIRVGNANLSNYGL
jgi:hypothetical protein